jgi:hypothetical protein
MKEEGIWQKLDDLKGEHRTWSAVSTVLGLSKQYLSYCLRKRRITPKLLEAMDLEERYVRAKQ